MAVEMIIIVYVTYLTSDALSYFYLTSTGNPLCPGERDVNERIQQSHQQSHLTISSRMSHGVVVYSSPGNHLYD